MTNNEALQLFENQPIRMAWNNEEEEWYFSIVDVVKVLTESPDSNNYWKVLKKRLRNEGNESVTNCNQLKLKSPKDGKRYKTDVANTEQLLRLIQSIPSNKAEPFKLWLAHIGKERINEINNPELIADRLFSTYEAKGYSKEWIGKRFQSIGARRELTDEWQARGIKQPYEYAQLTDEITIAWSDMTTEEYKNFKNLKRRDNLRDNMTSTELVLNTLAETATKDISQEEEPEGLEESRKIARRGGNIAGIARKALEQEIKKSAITSQNAKQIHKMIKAS